MHSEYADILSRFADLVARALAPRIATELRGVSAWIDQTQSPLGRNAHIAAVRRRRAEAKGTGRDPEAVITRGRYLMSPSALREEIELAHPSELRNDNETDDEAPDSYTADLIAKLRGLR